MRGSYDESYLNNMDILGVQKDIAELKALANQQQDRITTLEGQLAKDVNQVVDKVLAAVLPEFEKARQSIDTMTVAIDVSITEALGVIRRLNGAKLKITLGPES